MKIFVLNFVLFLVIFHSHAQQLENPFDEFYEDKIQYRDGIKQDTLLYNDKMLNILFAKTVGTAFGGSNDLSLQKYFATIDQKDNSLALGFNLDSRGGDELKKLTWIFSGGVKLKSKDEFSVIYTGNDFEEDNIGFNFKVSFIGDGIIDYTSINTGKLKKLRKSGFENFEENHIEKKYTKITDDFNTKNLSDFNNKLQNRKKFDSEVLNLTEALEKKKDSLYTAIAKEEVAFLEDSKMYNYLWDYWVSAEVYLPVGQNTYIVTPDINTSFTEEEFRPFAATISGTMMWKYSSGKSIYLSADAKFENTNNILVNNESPLVFQETNTGSDGLIVIQDNTNAYITEYKDFVNTKIRLEPAFFFTPTIGFSPALEFNVSSVYKATNWKLGIPISLKNQKGEPKVNFELQWKEINTLESSDHYVGISTSFLFGDLIN